MEAVTEKACRRCGEIKALDAFARKGKYRAARCKDCLREWAAGYRETSGDLINANARQGYATDPTRKKATKAAYYQRHSEAIRARARQKYVVGYAANPERWHAANARRKQLLAVAMDPFDRALSTGYRRAIRADGCTYCGLYVAGDMHVDHFYALAKGGTDHWWNLVQSCGSCNRHKHDKCGTWLRLRGACT
ncbi:HNH endonuclease [Streptomyces sp. OR43]|uniref:HNH endonuclease n=1 Tax=Streptomyces sp. or43 TaxID=2478957 RepID=UPI0011CDF948|nr:HNH endonuclease [Streptomyces sp. or43]TXS34765.1 hypothetical protein EAO72_40935 [Streptomyces sp. or43]